MKYNINNYILFLTIIALAMFGIMSHANAQTVTQPLSGVSTTAKVYTYTHMLSQTQKKDIRYIIVKSSNGDVKSCFDACDVCYKENKGYSQSGDLLRCNNCGNSFAIDGLGSQGSGGCWPGHLPHTLDAQNVIFTVADMLTGARYYPVKPVTEVSEANIGDKTLSFNWSVKSDLLTITMDSTTDRNIYLYTIDGKLCNFVNSITNETTVDVSKLNTGVYLLIVEENGRTGSQPILINE